MSNLFWSGEAGQRLDFGPFDTTGIIDGTTIDSVTVRVKANEDAEVDWDAQVIDASLREVTASVVTDGLLNAAPGVYRFSCFFWSAPGVLAFAADQQTVRFTERSVDFPTLVPPYFGWEARIADAEAAVDELAPRGTAQVLPDANTTLTSAARAVRQVAQTAHRYDPVPDGTTIGQRRTFERWIESASGGIFKNYFLNSDGSVAAHLHSEGQVEGAWTGTKWKPVGQDVRERILTPYNFEARLDGDTGRYVAENAAAQLWAASGSIAGQSNRLHFPEGVLFITQPLVFTGGADNFHNLRMTGSNGMARASRGSVIRYVGAPTTEPIVRGLGLTGCSFEDIIFDSNGLCGGPLFDISADFPSCSGLSFKRCLFLSARDQVDGTQFGVGPVTPTPSTQSDTFSFTDCLFLVQESSLTPAVYTDCFKTNQNGNTKNFSFTNCSFYGGRRGINWELASGTLTLVGNGSIGLCQEAIYQGGGILHVVTTQGERCGRAITKVGADAVALIECCEFNAGRTSDDIMVHATNGQLIIRGSRFVNGRGLREIVSINTGTEFVTFNGDENGEGLDATNEEVELRSLGTYPTYVDAVTGRTITYAPGTKLYIRDYDDSAAPVYVCKTSLTAGGAVMNWSGAGSGALWFVSPAKVVATATEQHSAGASGVFISEANYWDSNGDGFGTGVLSITDGTNHLLDPSYAISSANGVRTVVSSVGDRGGHPAAPERLSDKNNSITERPWRALGRQYFDSPYDRAGRFLFNGTDDGWSCFEIDGSELYKASTTIDIYLILPVRGVVTAARQEVTTQFANAAGNTTLNLYEGTSFQTILTAAANNLEAASGTVTGVQAAEYGTAWKAAIGVRPTSAWNTAWAVLLNLVTTGGNWGDGAVSNVTGKVKVWLKVEAPPRIGS